ncbi:hypothetical protein QVD99_004854 [Batrachochytrium dendrobatidis]|nr:hypothetical protein QVD99_004854 [Batrachochytrium dendrobatidis]
MHQLELSKQSTPTKYELFMRLIHEHFQDNYSREVEQLYIQWAKTHSKALPKSKKDKTLSIRELILVLKDYNILATLAAQITISFVPVLVGNQSNLLIKLGKRNEKYGMFRPKKEHSHRR